MDLFTLFDLIQTGQISDLETLYQQIIDRTKDPARVATTATLAGTYDGGAETLTANAVGALVIDTVNLIVGDRVLDKDQATDTVRGIYTVTVAGDGATKWVLTRSADFNSTADIYAGIMIGIKEGAVNKNTIWILVSKNPIILDTTSILWGSVGEGAAGDMFKAIYDINDNGIVDKAESIDDGIGNTATAVNIKDVVTKKHIQGTDQGLDIGGPNAVTVVQVKAAYTHSNVVTGNPHAVTKANVGLGSVVNGADITANNAPQAHTASHQSGGSDPIKLDALAAPDDNTNLDFSLAKHGLCPKGTNTGKFLRGDGTWAAIPGGGDMLKSTYDINGNGIVDRSEAVDDGAGNVSTAAEVKSAVDDDHTHANKVLLDSYSQTEVNIADAVTKKHTQNTDTKLDEGGANEVTAAEAKAAYDHVSSDGKNHSDVVLNNAHRVLLPPHRLINDSGTSLTELWSANKIDAVIAAVQAGASPKATVRVATESDGDIALTGLQTLDTDVVLLAGDRVGVTANTNKVENGIYIASASGWARATDFDGTPSGEVKDGVYFNVSEGTDHAGHIFMVISSGIVDVGTDTITFTETTGVHFGTTAGTAAEGNDSRIPSQDENNALVGTNGTPSTSNKYVTNSDPRNTDARTPAAHAASHTNGGDDIQSASNSQKGVATAAHITEQEALRAITTYADSPMIVEGGLLGNGGNPGTFGVEALTALFRTTNSVLAPLAYASRGAILNRSIDAPNITYFVILNYNAGSPGFSLSETDSTDERNFNIGKVRKDDSDNVHYTNCGHRLQDGVSKLHVRAASLRTHELASGSGIAYSGTNNFTMAEAVAYAGINRSILSSYDSASTTFIPVYGDGGAGFTEDTPRNTIDYLHYDDGDGTPGNIGNAKYGVHWVFRHMDDDHIYVRLGMGSYSLADAETAEQPPIPQHLTDFGLLIGKIIAPQAGGSFELIQMVTDTFFTGTAVSDHNQLGTLQGGTANEYYHDTAAEHTNRVAAAAVITDHTIVRGAGGARGIQDSGISIDDSNNITGVVGLTASGTVTAGTFKGTININTKSSGSSLTAAEIDLGVIENTGANTHVLPNATLCAKGATVTINAMDAEIITIDPFDANDSIYDEDGATTGGGKEIVSDGTLAAKITFYLSDNSASGKWRVLSTHKTWTPEA